MAVSDRSAGVGSRRTMGTGVTAMSTLHARNSSLCALPGWVRIVEKGVIRGPTLHLRNDEFQLDRSFGIAFGKKHLVTHAVDALASAPSNSHVLAVVDHVNEAELMQVLVQLRLVTCAVA